MHNFETEYLSFKRGPDSDSGLTQTWFIYSKNHGDILGKVSWYSAWRQYVFSTRNDPIFNKGCLNDIATFLEDLAHERNMKRAAINLAAG